MQNIPVMYNGHSLLPVVVEEGHTYAAMVVVECPEGRRWASGVLDHFENADAARRFAISCGQAYAHDIDHVFQLEG